MDLRLPAAAGELTRAEQKILDYINTNTDTFLFSSIGQLAERLELSDATVSRFARHVGCRDFKALKSLVLEQSPGPAVKLAATLSQGARFSPQAWLERQRAYLETTIQQLSTGEFDRAVEALCSAQRVFIHGKNASASLAQLLHFRLRRLGLQVSLLPSGGSELLEGLSQVGAERPGGAVQLLQTLPGGPRPPGAQPGRRLPDAGLCGTHLPARGGAGGRQSVRLPRHRKGVPLHGCPRRPAGRPGRRCGGAVRSRKRGTPSVAAPDEKRLLSGWMNASPMRVYTWGMRSFSRITHGFYTHFTAPR